MSAGDYLLGVAYFVVTLGSVVAAATLVLRGRLGHLQGAAAALGLAVLVTTGLFVVHVVPGLLGVLSPAAAAVAAIAVLIGALSTAGATVARPGHRGTTWQRVRQSARAPRDRLMGALALAGIGLVATWSAAAAWAGTVIPSVDIDTLTFHLPNVAKWIQTGSVWRTDQFVPLLANGNYPQSGDVVMLTVVLPWDSDAFVRVVGLPFAAVCGLAVYALATEAGSRRAPAGILAAVFTTLPVFVFSAYEGAKTDVIMLAMFGAGTYFLLRARRDGRRSSLVLAGLGLALALGTKWYALWSVPLVMAVWGGAWLASRGQVRTLIVRAAGVGGLVVLVGGLWMLRNAIESGSPIYPSAVAPLGVTIFDAPRDFVRECAGFTIVGYLDSPGVLRRFILPAFWTGYGAPGVILAIGWLGAFGMVIRRLRDPERRDWRNPVVALVATVPLLALAYAAAPYSAIGALDEPSTEANLRWLLPALLLAAAASAWALSELGRLQPPVLGVVLLAVIAGVDDAFEASVPFASGLAGAGGVAGVVVVGALMVVLWRSGRTPRRAVVAGAVVLGLIGALVVGDRRQERFYSDRYTEDPVLAELGSASSGSGRVGLAGVWTIDGLSPVLPAFGPRFERDVAFVGPMVDGQLREYASRARFFTELRTGEYELLVVGRGIGAYGGCAVPGSESDEDAWMRAAGYPLIAQTHRLSLYRVSERRPGGPRVGA